MGFFPLRRRVLTGSGAHPTYPVDTRSYYPWGKGGGWLGSEADHSISTSAEVKNARSYTYIPPVRLNVVVRN
jgi:hypothetical protein